MKKVLLSMMTAAMFFASCSSDETTVPENNGAVENNQEELVAIKLGTGSRVGTTVVESRAAVEEWNANQIGVFALDRNKAWDNTIEDDDKPVLLFNELGTVGSAEVDGETEKIEVIWTNAENNTLFYPRYSTRTYSFFAYHPYVADENVTIPDSNDRIRVKGTFTGKEDIMAGKAICETSEGYNAKYFRDLEKNGSEETPDILFEHLTTRLIINVAPGHKYNPETCTIETLSMAVPSEYTMTLAFLNQEDYQPTIVWGSETAVQQFGEKIALTPVDPEAENKTYQKSEGVADILAKPGAKSYDLILTLPGINEEITAPVVLEDGEFEAGKAYTITLTINGPQEILVTASLTEWDYVEGEIEVEI